MIKKASSLAVGGLLASMTTGCGMFGGDIEGIWLFYLTAVTEDSECEDSVDHNHEDAELREEQDDSDWEINESSELSDSIVVGQVVLSDKKNGVLFINGAAYPGTGEKGAWTFKWEGTENTEYEEIYEGADYEYSYEAAIAATQTITMNVDGSAATGNVKGDYSSEQEWKEVDEWDDMDCPQCGQQIPFGSYLDVEGDGGPGGKPTTVAAYNSVDEECNGGECELKVDTTCPSVTQPMQATFLGYDDPAAYDGVEEDGQPYGAL